MSHRKCQIKFIGCNHSNDYRLQIFVRGEHKKIIACQYCLNKLEDLLIQTRGIKNYEIIENLKAVRKELIQ